MEKSELIEKIENGKQVGVSGIIERDGREFSYKYAVQKIRDNYIVYIEEYFMDEMDYDYPERYERFEVYSSLTEVFEIFRQKYNILPEDMNTSRGNKFFWDENINLARYTGETESLTLTHNKVYNIISIEKKWFRIVDDSGEDYLYPPELFERIYGNIMFRNLDGLLSYNDTMDYWYDEGFCHAREILADFSDDDWKSLSAVIRSRSTDYQKKLVYCFDGTDEAHEIKIIEKLLSVNDNELFIMCIDSLRNFSIDSLRNKRLLDKIKAKSNVSGKIPEIIIKQLLNRL